MFPNHLGTQNSSLPTALAVEPNLGGSGSPPERIAAASPTLVAAAGACVSPSVPALSPEPAGANTVSFNIPFHTSLAHPD